MTTQGQGQTRHQRHGKGQVVVVVITGNGQERLVEHHPLMAQAGPLLPLLEPFPIGAQKIVAVLIRCSHQIDDIPGVKQKGRIRLVG